ncbi:hypothetical protein HK104_010162 [Borealophlyctis nickersoniae]|nr:hypothetical protein HK104_010162 [Borealophlyctis nickersoniae]
MAAGTETAAFTAAQGCPYDFLVALHVDTTCDEHYLNNASSVSRDHAETLAISFAVISVSERRILHKQQVIVKPGKTPMTAFVSQMTGITDAQLDAAVSLTAAVAEIDSFVQTHFTSRGKTFCFITHGDRDLRYQLSRESREKGLLLPSYFNVFYDIGQEINSWLFIYHGANRRSSSGTNSLVGLCAVVGVQCESQPTGGLEMAILIGQITLGLLNVVEQYFAALTTPVPESIDIPLSTPIDLQAQRGDFHATLSKIVHLGGLPYKATNRQGLFDIVIPYQDNFSESCST